jgi:2-polyprenyl-6-hydroxyphenyl methylase/3-demethylubiquinone-9 3-methyltransferase
MRTISQKEYIHDKLGDQFESALSMYDTQCRIQVLIDEFLRDQQLEGKRILDVGTGLGFFAGRLQQRGAIVTAVDIGENLLKRVKQRLNCECLVVDALALSNYFGRDRFDFVVSSECIEHTPDPLEALKQMAAVVKPGGLISVSTPNVVWKPVVAGATALKLRPFEGFENFSTFGSIRGAFESAGATVVREKGLHLFPFQLKLPGLSRWCDDHLQAFRFLMINLCVLARKRQVTS